MGGRGEGRGGGGERWVYILRVGVTESTSEVPLNMLQSGGQINVSWNYEVFNYRNLAEILSIYHQTTYAGTNIINIASA